MGSSANTNGMVLNSWKEIANHLGRGVRTVQRWEHVLGLPVRRPRGTSRSAVVALSDELDAWLRSAPKQEVERETAPPPQNTLVLNRQLLSDGKEIRSRCDELRNAHYRVVAALMSNLEIIKKNLMTSYQSRALREEAAGSPLGSAFAVSRRVG